MEALQSGRSPQKNNGEKVNVCLVETPVQLVSFGHDGLRSSLGQNALGLPFIGFIHTVAVCSMTTGFYTDAWRAVSCTSRYSVILEADNFGFVHVRNHSFGIIHL